MKEFYRKHPLVVHLLGVIVTLALFAFGSILILNGYTKHGQTITVPDLNGKKLSEVQRLLDTRKLAFAIVDSSYSDKVLPLTVIDQNPKPGSRVKEERTIYLTINALNPPKVKMPDLRDASLKQAQLELESLGLKVGKLSYKPDLALNAVLDQQVRGKRIEPGSQVPKGTRIDLVVGDGLGQTEIEVPHLVGLTLGEARFVLEGVGLNLGSVVTDNTIDGDASEAVVYKQVPDPSDPISTIKQGEPVDVFVSFDRSKLQD
jgi:eukaryotic-like serine/threonine-protein kinase